MDPLLSTAIIVLLLVTNAVTLILLLRGRGLSTLPTREQYRELHPQSIDHLGRLRCHQCSSTTIHVDWKAFDMGLNIHSCNHCGIRLYRT
ncbi:MAG TPA: hypothetical protein VFG21_05610 [Xanthomonadaceae bacterium]|nr:hypothetical protein [Xanthomonadaceae bacterium]